MVFKISDLNARYLRMSAQGLMNLGAAPSLPANQVVKSVVGIQAQEQGAAFLSIHSRGPGLKITGVKKELLQERSIVQSWLMRGTLHLLATDDMDWLLPLLAPIFIKKNLRRYKELGLDEASIHRGVQIIREQLASHRPMTRHELAHGLLRQAVNTRGQALIYLINRAAWEGVLCLGPRIGGNQTYAYLPDWIGRSLRDGNEMAHGLLAERYLAAYAPAGPKDFGSWSGLPSNMVREAWAQLNDNLIEVEFPGGRSFILSDQASTLEDPVPDSLGVQLLPRFDTFLLGYADRNFFVADEHLRRVNAGGGILRPVLLVEGRVQGIWYLTHQKSGVKVQVETFNKLSGPQHELLLEEVESIGRFLNVEAVLQS
jgi:hypothetical protein